METIETLLQKTKELIVSLSDPERKSLSAWYYPTSMEVFGLSSASQKKIVAETRKALRRDLPSGYIPLALALCSSGIFELQQVAYGLLNRNFGQISALSYKDIMMLGSYMDNWVSTDSFSTQVAGPAWRLGVLKDHHIVEWAGSEDYWWRRNALVATVGLNLKSQGGSGDAARTLMICELLLDDRQDMVVKAMSWALRELSKHDREPVELFMASYSGRLASRVKREVGKKLLTGRKNG